MPQETFGDYKLLKRAGEESGLTNGAEDISSGVAAEVGDISSGTLYLSVSGPVDVTVEVSPDGGSNWYVLPESPKTFEGTGDTAIHLEYNFTDIRVSASNGTAVKAQLREVV